MTDNIAPDIATHQNTKFMEQRVLDTQTAFPNSILKLPKSVDNEMADGEWSVKHQLMKPVLVRQAQWQTTNARNERLIEFSFPGILTTESLIRDTLAIYSLYKMSPCFRIQINATQFNAGQLICSFDPFTLSSATSPTTYNADVYNVFSATGFPHVRIMASESDPVELKVPFIHPRNFLTTNVNTFDNLGYFRVSVLNPLTAADSASSNVTVSVWIYAADSEVHVPINIHEPILEATSLIGSSLLSPLANLASNATNKIGNAVTMNAGQALKTIGGLLNPGSDKLDYPSISLSSEKTIIPVENLAVGIGRSRSQRLALDPFSMNPTPDDIAGETMESMDLLDIVRTPFLITQVGFKTTDPIGTRLFTIPVHPAIAPNIYNNTVPPFKIRQPTYLSYVSNAFSYWSGGISFDIEIVATRFHVGKLLFAYLPNSGDPSTFAQASSALPSVVIDIQQTSHFTFTVPWNSSISMKSTSLLSNVNYSEVINGSISCFVLNTLNAPSNVASSIEFNVYAYAASDYNLYVPSRPLMNTASTVIPSLESTSGISIEADSNQPHPTSVFLSKDQNLSRSRPHFGESYSLIDLIKRFSYLTTYTTQDVNTIDVAPIKEAGTLFNRNQSISILQYFAYLYSAWSGSIRYKLAFNTNRMSTTSITTCHIPNIDSYNFLVTTNLSTDEITQFYGNARTHLSQDSAIEIEAPYYSKYNMLITRDSTTSTKIPSQYFSNGIITINPKMVGGDNFIYDIYIAAGDDFRFIYRRPPPQDITNINVYTLTPTINI